MHLNLALSSRSSRHDIVSLSFGDMPIVHKMLSSQNRHRFGFQVGPHKPPHPLAVENVIRDAIFRLAESRIFVYTVLRDLANFLPWSDIDMANCHCSTFISILREIVSISLAFQPFHISRVVEILKRGG